MRRERNEMDEKQAVLEERFLQKLASLLNTEDLSDLPEELHDEHEKLPDIERWR